jgi:hypothetical protein
MARLAVYLRVEFNTEFAECAEQRGGVNLGARYFPGASSVALTGWRWGAVLDCATMRAPVRRIVKRCGRYKGEEPIRRSAFPGKGQEPIREIGAPRNGEETAFPGEAGECENSAAALDDGGSSGAMRFRRDVVLRVCRFAGSEERGLWRI